MMFPAVPTLVCSLSFAALLDILVVQPNGPVGTFADIQSACDQAHERDTILVKAGSYASFQVVDKWLTIASDAGASASVTGTIQVSGLEAGRRVTLIGFISTSSSYRSLQLTANQGAVRVTNCYFRGFDASPGGSSAGDAVVIDHCSDVSMSNCTGFAGLTHLGYTGIDGSAGMHVTHSSVALYDCNLQGSDGSNGDILSNGGAGGDGCRAEFSELFASHTTFRGGDGGDGAPSLSFTLPGVGGNGLDQSGGIARLVSPIASGGAPGFGPMGYPGTALIGCTILPVTLRSMSALPNPIREGASLTIGVTGIPGDNVGLVFTTLTSSMFNAAWNGQQLFPAGSTFMRFGTISASGSLVQHMPIADLGPGITARTYQMQALFAGTDGHRVLGTPVSLLVLDSAY